MKLGDILVNTGLKTDNGNIKISHITMNSADVIKGTIFFAVKGSVVDGNNFIKDAVKKGASLIVSEQASDTSIPLLISDNLNRDMAVMAGNFYRHPWKDMTMTGITGTNGKTTTSYILRSIFSTNGKTGLIGTINHYIGNEEIPAQNTTPDTLLINSLLRKMADKKVKHCIMEVSSHGLKLGRVQGIEFDHVLFTNLTQDHLDFHKNMTDYREAKLILMGMLKKGGFGIINNDDRHSAHFAEACSNSHTVGIRKRDSQWTIDIKGISMEGSDYVLNLGNKKEFCIHTPLVGDHNIYNSAMAFITAYYAEYPVEDIIKGIENIKNVPGRFEKFSAPGGFYAVADYAHTPDALERVIKTAKRLTRGRVITVFGCGGDRDKKKRPIMGKIAAHYSDYAVITSDNPRTEDPQAIIDDIIEGINQDNYIIEINRKNAIIKALRMAKREDTVIIAGKGHEDYQIIGRKKHHFDDREIIRSVLKIK